MVGRRRDQADAGRRVAGLGDPRPDLLAGELTAFAGLGALGHLDLDVVGVGQVFRRDAEAAGGNLLDRRTLRVAVLHRQESHRVLAALAGVGLAAEAVHRDRKGLVGFGRDRPVAHRAGREALDDLGDRLDLVDRHRLPIALELEQAAERGELGRLVVDERRVLLEDVVALRAGAVLQLEHGLRVEQVMLTLAAPLVLAAELEFPMLEHLRAVGEGSLVTDLALGGEFVEPDAADLGGGAGEVLVDEVLREADGLEDLGAGVGGHRGDAHLRHHLDHALRRGPQVVLACGRDVGGRLVPGDPVLDGLHDQGGANGGGTEAE